MHTASLYGEIEIVKLIYHFEEDFNRPLYSGKFWSRAGRKLAHFEMPIFTAIENGHTEVVKFIANTSRELQNSSMNFYEEPAIYVAISHKNLDLAKFLVPRTQNLNKIYGWIHKDSLIHASVRSGDINILKYLISLPGIDPNIENSELDTALHKLCRKEFTTTFGIPQKDVLGMIKILAPLVDANNHMNYFEGASPLHDVVKEGSIEILKILVKYLNVNVKSFSGFIPIEVAVYENDIEAIKILTPYLRMDMIHSKQYNSETVELFKSLIEERNRISED